MDAFLGKILETCSTYQVKMMKDECTTSNYSPDRHVCHVCNKSLKGKAYQTYKGKLYDPQCFATVYATLCDSCHKPIEGENVDLIKDNDKCYHTRCYQCYLCHRTLQGIPHFTAENKMRLCVPCLTS